MPKSRHSSSSKATSSSKSVKSLIDKYGFHGPAELYERRKSRQDFFIKTRYLNSLPDVPCEPKHILMPLNPNRFEISSVDLSSFYEQLIDWNCGVSLDLVGSTITWRGTGESPSHLELDPKDQFLLEDDTTKEAEDMVKRSKTHKTNVTWLRRPEYISSEPAKFKTLNGEKVEFRMDKAIGKKMKSQSMWEEASYLNNHKLRVTKIENSFEISSDPILEHPSKPGVFALEVTTVFPDFDLQDHQFVEIVFDTSPSMSGQLGKIEEFQMSNALLQPMAFNEEEEDIERIGYFVPSSSSAEDNMTDNEASESCEGKEFLMARDYIFKQGTRNMSSVHDTYAFIEREGMLTYCDINKRINLNRSIKIDSQSSFRRAKLMVKYLSSNNAQTDTESGSIDCASTVVSGLSGFSVLELESVTPTADVVSDFQ